MTASNWSLLHRIDPQLAIQLSERSTDDTVSLFKASHGPLSARINIMGSSISVHSAVDPIREAASIASSRPLQSASRVVLLGVGLGYLALALVQRLRPDQVLILIEPNLDLFRAALTMVDLSTVLQHAALHLWVGLSAPRLSAEVAKISATNRSNSATEVFVAPYAKQLYDEPIHHAITHLSQPSITPRHKAEGYPKFRSPEARVLLLDSDYFLLRETTHAFAAEGHRLEKIIIGRDNCRPAFIDELLQTLRDKRPDFILTFNHLGFDETGRLTDLLEKLKIPLAVWYVDSPSLILRTFQKNESAWTVLFLWDRSYEAEMRRFGFDHVYWLPLATDPTTFSTLNADCRERYRLGFVGDSLVEKTICNHQRLNLATSDQHLITQGVELVLAHPRSSISELNNRIAPILGQLPVGTDHFDALAAIIWAATQNYRQQILSIAIPYGLHIFGDDGWKNLFPSADINLHPRVSYYDELPDIYRHTAINLNATSYQMAEAVNQRVFDVAAAGAFLLTDYQPDLEDLFEIGQEIVTYRNGSELDQLIPYYLENQAERETIAACGRRHILAKHTYRHRIQVMINIMRRHFS